MTVKRKPKLKSAQRRKAFLDDEHITQVLKELERPLTYEAKKISRPSHISDEDLVQEALAHIFSKRAEYNENMGASIKTWGVTIGRNKLYNLAKSQISKKRVPTDENGDTHIPIEFNEEITAISSFNVEEEIRYQELIAKTERKLSKTAKKVFNALLDPPRELIEQIKKERIQQLRERRGGARSNVSFTLAITNESLASFFDIPYSAVVRAKDDIHYAIQVASNEW